MTGRVTLAANSKQSYDVDMVLKNTSTNFESTNFLDLKNPLFRYTGQPPQPPPGTQSQTQSPTENFWGNLAQSGVAQVNGQVQSGLQIGQNMMQNGYNGVINQANSGVYGAVNVQPGQVGGRGASSPTAAVTGVRVAATQGITTGVASMTVNTRPPMGQQQTFQSNVPPGVHPNMQFDTSAFGDFMNRFPSQPQQFMQNQNSGSGAQNHLGLAQSSH